MYTPDTELLFPLRVTAALRGLRGEGWARLCDRVSDPETPQAEKIAFTLMMVRLGGCVSCNADSFRAMKGCSICARQTVRRIRGSDEELIEQHRQLVKEVELFLKNRSV